jgi:hypothetical protein
VGDRQSFTVRIILFDIDDPTFMLGYHGNQGRKTRQGVSTETYFGEKCTSLAAIDEASKRFFAHVTEQHYSS